jgi:hypothetical protein
MEMFMQIEADDAIKPMLFGDNKRIKALAPDVIFRCQHIFTVLESLNIEMARNPQIRS